MDKSFYYNGNILLTYNALFNFVIGNRGAGKTYWFKKWAINDFLKNGNEFIYLRRYDTEFNEGKKERFFDDIASEFPDHSFKVKGYVAYIDDKVAGYFKALSKAKIEKSVPFPNVDKVGYDEFILDTGVYHYLKDEVMNFLEFYETVARLRDNVRVFFLSNAITLTNPYFLYFRIQPNKKRYQRIKDDIMVELVANESFIKEKKKTRFGKLIDGTKYGEYAIENSFLRDNDTFVEKKTGYCKFDFGLIYNGQKYGIWWDYKQGLYFVSKDVDPNNKFIFTLTMQDHTPNTQLIKGTKINMIECFIKYYKLGRVRYESINLKNITYEIIRLFLL